LKSQGKRELGRGNLIRRTRSIIAGWIPWADAALEKPGNLRTTLLRSGLGSLVLSVTHIGCSFLISVALARMLGADGFGSYSFAYALAMVIGIPAQSGISQLVIRETARGVTNEDWGATRGLWIWSTRTVLVLALASGTLLVAGSAALDADPTVTLAAGLIPFVALGSLRGAALIGLQRVVVGQLPESVLRPIGFLLLLFITPALFGWNEISPVRAIGLQIITSMLAFSAGAILLARFRPEPMRASKPVFQSRIWGRTVLPMSLVAGLQLLIANTDILMLGALRSDAEVGVYRVVSQCSLLVVFGAQAFNMVVAPHFSRLYAQHNFPALQKLTMTTARVGVGIALPLGAAFTIWGETILEGFFGLEYVAGYIALLILIWGRVLNSALGQVGLLLQMTGNEKYALAGTVFAASANIVLNLLLVPPFGVEGAATATAMALVFSHLLLRHFVRVNVKIETSIAHFTVNSGGKA
jgi:O-antigen/teichoic acid export membrane protein